MGFSLVPCFLYLLILSDVTWLCLFANGKISLSSDNFVDFEFMTV